MAVRVAAGAETVDNISGLDEERKCAEVSIIFASCR